MLVISKHVWHTLVKESVVCADSYASCRFRDLFTSPEFQDLMSRLAAGVLNFGTPSKQNLVPAGVIMRYTLHAWEICRTSQCT
jgi:hypothetical protein